MSLSVLGSKTVAAALFAVLFLGLMAGGLRDPMDWAAASALLWSTALLGPRQAPPRPLRAWLLLLAWVGLALLASDQPLKGLPSLSRWAAMAVFLGLASSWGERERRRWFWGFCAVGVILAAAALYGAWNFGSWNNRADRGETMYGLLPPYYNYTVFVLCGGCAAACAALVHREGPKGLSRLLPGALLILSGLVFYHTRARGGVLALAGASALILWRAGHLRKLLYGAAVLGLVMVLFKGQSLWLMKLDKAAVFKRPQLWRAALQVAGDHPVAGVGPGNFEQGFLLHNFASRYRVTNYQFSTAFAHSEPLQAAAETGWPGLALLAAAVFALFRLPRNGGFTREAALAAFAAMTLQCLIDNMLQLPALALLYVSALACLRDGGEPEPDPAWTPAAWRGLCLAGLGLALVSWLPERLSAHLRERDTADVRSAHRAVLIFPADARLRERLARAWLAQQPPQPALALAELERASALDPTGALYIVMRCEILRLLGRFSDLAPLSERALELEPNCLQARLLKAELLARAGLKEAARGELREVELRREELRRLRLYVPDRALYTGYDLTIGAFDAGRFDLVSRLAR